MPKRLSVLLMAILVLGLLACASIPRTPKQAYLAARTTFNDALESYITQKAMAHPETQIEWEAEIEPIFGDAQEALNIWGLAIAWEGSDVMDKQAAYDEIRLELFRLLFKFGILEIK